MPKKSIKYKVGDLVWNWVGSRAKPAWRIGIVTAIDTNDNSYYAMTVMQPGVYKATREIWAHLVDNEVMRRDAIPAMPNGTIYLINTEIGRVLSERIPQPTQHATTMFEVYECATRMQTRGALTGYMVFPGGLDMARAHGQQANYKSWVLSPSVSELLNFLGNNLGEIIGIYHTVSTGGKQ